MSLRTCGLLFLSSFLTLCWSFQTRADALDINQLLDESPPKLELKFRSDVWTTPTQNKSNPLRVYNIQFLRPVLQYENWDATLVLKTEGLRIGNAGLAVGEEEVDIGGDLRTQTFGFALENNREDSSSTVFLGAYTSESDEPFQNRRDVSFDFAVFHKFAREGSWQWVAGFDHAKNRGLFNERLIPILGILYQPHPEFSAIFGFPFLEIFWNTKPWQKTLTLTVRGLDGQFSYLVDDFVTLYARAGVANRSYMHTQRIQNEKRIIFEETYMEVAALRKISERTAIESSVGSSFNRKLYEARQVLSPIGPVVTLRHDLYASLKMEFLF